MLLFVQGQATFLGAFGFGSLDFKEQKMLCSFISAFHLDSICCCLLHLASALFLAWVEFMLLFPFPILLLFTPGETQYDHIILIIRSD